MHFISVFSSVRSKILVELIEMIQKGLAGFRRFLDVMETEPEIKDASDAEEFNRCKKASSAMKTYLFTMLMTIRLSFLTYLLKFPPEDQSLLSVRREVEKSTICSLLPRFYDVTGGRITIDGKDVRTLTLKSLRSHIGVVQQDVYLFRERFATTSPTENRTRRMKRS